METRNSHRIVTLFQNIRIVSNDLNLTTKMAARHRVINLFLVMLLTGQCADSANKEVKLTAVLTRSGQNVCSNGNLKNRVTTRLIDLRFQIRKTLFGVCVRLSSPFIRSSLFTDSIHQTIHSGSVAGVAIPFPFLPSLVERHSLLIQQEIQLIFSFSYRPTQLCSLE